MAAAKKGDARLRRLRDQAAELMSAQKYDRAVAVYEELSRLEETNGEWARRAADCHWHLKNSDQRLKFSLLAAKAYSEAGLMLKAIAMCKVVLSIDPNHRETQQELADLHAKGTPGRPRAAAGRARRQPLGETITSEVAAQSADAPPRDPSRRRNSLRPSTPEGDAKNEERTRARMAAAAALRQARAQLKKDDLTETASRRADASRASIPNQETSRENPPQERISVPDANVKPSLQAAGAESKAPTADERVLARIALKSLSRDLEKPRAPAFDEPKTVSVPEAPPVIPSLFVTPSKVRTPRPGLVSLRLSERVPARSMDSLPPARGNVYSLALGEIPNAEFRALRVPDIKLPKVTSDDLLYVPVIPPPDEELLPDSVDTDNISFGSALSPDRLEVANKDFGQIPLLSDLPADVLRQLITDVAMVELDTGEVLFNEGDPADAMYVVVEGSVTAITLPHRDKPIQLAHLFEGDFFGEIGLMSDQPRGATVQAHEPTRLLRFDRDIVAVLIEQDPNFLATLLQFLKDRLVEDLMMSSPLFTPFNQNERFELADQFEFLEIEPDSVLLERGQLPIGMYVLLTGAATMKGASEAGTIRRLGPGDIFGEQALLSNEVSKVEVRTSVKSFALCLPSDAFPEVIASHPAVLAYLSTLTESSKGELDVAEDFLDHIRFF
jgi:CRP-like cAMP-binding protein/tetratricopeptide (TPR) repeat protein